jgi:hypothetical protein
MLVFFAALGLAIVAVALSIPEEQMDEWEEFLAAHSELVH